MPAYSNYRRRYRPRYSTTRYRSRRTRRGAGRPTRVSGRGSYRLKRNFFNARKIGGRLGAAAGAALGGYIAPGIGSAVGGMAGRRLGRAAGGLFKTVTGWGDYNVTKNSLLFPDQDVPVFGDDSIRVKHREYICDIDASTGFVNTSMPINPGLDDVFPWLTSIARNYEQYRFNGLIFQFVSTSSDAIADTTNLGLGTVCLATDYNAADPDFVNMPQALNSMFANSSKPSCNIMHAIECAPSEQANKLYFVRTGEAPDGTDIRLYDLGKFQVCTQGMPSGAVYTAGQLWVTYDVTFTKSISNNQLGYALNTDKYLLTAPSQVSNKYFGTSRTLQQNSDLGTTVTDNTIVFPPLLSAGYYQVTYTATGASTALLQPSVGVNNGALIFAWVNNSQQRLSNTGSTAAVFMMSFVVQILEPDCVVTFGTPTAGTLPTSPTTGDLLITQVNGQITWQA